MCRAVMEGATGSSSGRQVVVLLPEASETYASHEEEALTIFCQTAFSFKPASSAGQQRRRQQWDESELYCTVMRCTRTAEAAYERVRVTDAPGKLALSSLDGTFSRKCKLVDRLRMKNFGSLAVTRQFLASIVILREFGNARDEGCRTPHSFLAELVTVV